MKGYFLKVIPANIFHLSSRSVVWGLNQGLF
jgi:hypothetical protein